MVVSNSLFPKGSRLLDEAMGTILYVEHEVK